MSILKEQANNTHQNYVTLAFQKGKHTGKTCRRETLNLLTCADNSTDTKNATNRPPANSHCAQQDAAADLDLDPSTMSCKNPTIANSQTNVLTLVFPKDFFCN